MNVEVARATVSVVIGSVDTHKVLHVAAVIDQNNKILFLLDTAGIPEDAGMDDLIWNMKTNRCCVYRHIRFGIVLFE